MHLWDRIPGEPMLWYARFEVYRSLGPSRTMQQAYRITAQAQALRKQWPGTSWFSNARAWDWKERAAAWDIHERDRLRDLEEDRRFDAREQRLSMIDQLLSAIFQVLATANLGDIDAESARAWLPTLRVFFKDLLHAQRNELGLPAEAKRDPNRPAIAPFSADELVRAQQELAQLHISISPSFEQRGIQTSPSFEQRGIQTNPSFEHRRTKTKGAYIEGDVDVSEGSFIGRDKSNGNSNKRRSN